MPLCSTSGVLMRFCMTWVSSYEIDPFAVPTAEKVALFTAWSRDLLGHDDVDHVDVSLQQGLLTDVESAEVLERQVDTPAFGVLLDIAEDIGQLERDPARLGGHIRGRPAAKSLRLPRGGKRSFVRSAGTAPPDQYDIR